MSTMSEEKTSISVSSSSVVPTKKNTITQLEQDEKIIIRELLSRVNFKAQAICPYYDK